MSETHLKLSLFKTKLLIVPRALPLPCGDLPLLPSPLSQEMTGPPPCSHQILRVILDAAASPTPHL